ncbi:MAG: cytochrome, partial [Rhodococcus erythropolis]|nr:cytochrome [Rhodococcus erythropolis]
HEKVYERIEALDSRSFDVVADFSALFPNEVITTMLGVPKQDREQIRQWLDLLLERRPGEIAVPPEGFEASMNTGVYYYNLIQERRRQPCDDMISRLIETEIERDGVREKLTDVDIAGFATLLGGAGAETVTKLIGNAIGHRGTTALPGTVAVPGQDRHPRRDAAWQDHSARKRGPPGHRSSYP